MKATTVLLAAALVSAACGSGAQTVAFAHEPPWTHVDVMTRNVYYGAELGGAIAAVLGGDPGAIVAAVSEVHAQLEASDFHARARALALEIQELKPDLIGVQEAALWRTQYPSDAFTGDPTPAQVVAYDLLAILIDELAGVGLQYEVAVELATVDAELPRALPNGDLEDLRFTDREAILVRSDANLTLVDPQAAWFDAIVVLPNGLPIPQGWVSVDAMRDGSTFRFISTHLEADIQELRVAQAAELLAGPADTDLPVVLVGDFNSDARPGNVDSPAFDALLAGGFDYAAPRPRTQGTCCLDDLHAPGDPAAFEQQIDLVLARSGGGITFFPSDWEVVGPTLAEVPIVLWSSDHAGVSVRLSWRP